MGESKIGPFNLVTQWYWIDDESGARIELDLIRQSILIDGKHIPQLVAELDQNGDNELRNDELVLNAAAAIQIVKERLRGVGVRRPEIRSVIEAHPIAHGVTNGKGVIRKCTSCHSTNSRLTGNIDLAQRLPAGVSPVPGDRWPKLTGGALELSDNEKLLWRRDKNMKELYVFGHSRTDWSDKTGFGIFILSALGLLAHGGYRFVTRKKRTKHATPTQRVYMYGAYERIWHWLMAMSILALILTGFEIHYPATIHPLGFPTAVALHNFLALVMVANAFLALFFHLASNTIRQFIPEHKGLLGQLLDQVQYYTKGIFLGAPHPTSKTQKSKLNPLQQITYLGLLNVLFPFQILTGALIWIPSRWPEAFEAVNGLSFIAPLHNLGSWLFVTFLIVHVYLTTTGHTLLSNISAMIDGYDEIEVKQEQTPARGGQHV